MVFTASIHHLNIGNISQTLVEKYYDVFIAKGRYTLFGGHIL